jgi:hypothetical protein
MRLNRFMLHCGAILFFTRCARCRCEYQRCLDQRSRSVRAALGDQRSQALRKVRQQRSADFYSRRKSSAAAALSSGDAQVGMFSPQVVISTPALDLVMFGRLGNTMDNRVYARKRGIKSIKEVKRVAISRFGSNADFAARFLLQREGLRPDVDVALLQVGNQSNRIAAVETNNADAAMLTPPMTLQWRGNSA